MSDYYESEESIKDLLELESNEDLKSESKSEGEKLINRLGEWDSATGTSADIGVRCLHPAERKESHS